MAPYMLSEQDNTRYTYSDYILYSQFNQPSTTPTIDDMHNNINDTTQHRQHSGKQQKLSQQDHIAIRKQRHANSDFIRRQRMKQLLSEMQELSNATVNDQTGVVAAGLDTIRSLQQQVHELQTKLQS